MYLKKNFPYLVGVFVVAVGVFFCLSTLFRGAFLNPEPPGSRFLIAVSIIFIGAGIYLSYLFKKGKLKKAGNSITEVRREAVETLKDPAMLAQIALDDNDPEIRKTAGKRLEEITN
jgi:hypothetical protein